MIFQPKDGLEFFFFFDMFGGRYDTEINNLGCKIFSWKSHAIPPNKVLCYLVKINLSLS